MKVKIFILSFLTFFIFVPFIFAEADTSTPENAQDQKETTASDRNRTKMKEKKNEITTDRKEKMLFYFTQMKVRIQALVDRIQKLIDKIDTRVIKIDSSDTENKIDTTNTKKDLVEANTKLSEVKSLVDNLTIDETLLSETPKGAFNFVREDVKSIKTGLKEVHSLLVKIIGDIKGLRIGDQTDEK